MIPGGIADKLGNRYEAKWLVRQIFRVLFAEASWLKFEGLAKEYDGFEFAVGKEGYTEWHQTKVTAPNGNWTINALKNEGVLAAFKARLAFCVTNTCFFVSEEPAKDAKTLCQKARIANSLCEFENNLSKEQSPKFTDISDIWEVDKETAWQWLRRSFFQVESTSELDSNIHNEGQRAFENTAGTQAFSSLRDYMERHFNVEITTEKLREDLNDLSDLRLKDWSLIPTLREDLKRETQAYLKTYIPFGAGGETIQRKEAQQIFETLLDPKSPKLVLLTGVAGSGKSGVVRELIGKLEKADLLHLAFRVDHHLDCQKPDDFGEAILQRNESPTVTLKGISPEKTSVLIIDQVDAVSEVSGRNGGVRNALLRLLDGLKSFRTVRVVLVCRNYDFENDPRLKEMRDKVHENRFDVQHLDWESEIVPILATKGFDLNKFTPAQKDLLKLPLNLAVYLEVAEKDLNFASRDDLFRALIRKKELDLRGRNLAWTPMKVLERLADWMSERQRLEAPENILDDFPEAQDILQSEGLIVSSRQHVNFFHESFFDYAYAQSFGKSSKSLRELLLSDEQHLFRRTQCRQILEVMRKQDPRRYFATLSDILSGADIRYHIKLAIAQWLGTLDDPTPQERDIVMKLEDASQPFPPLVQKACFHSAGWFDLHCKDGWLLSLLDDPVDQRKNKAFWLISEAAKKRPIEAAALLRDWWKDDPKKADTLLNRLGSFREAVQNPDFENLCVDIVRSKPPGLFSDEAIHKREMLVTTWIEENSERGAPLLKAFWDTWFELHPGEHPFITCENKAIDLHSIDKVCKKAPIAFLESSLDAFVQTLKLIPKIKQEKGWERTFDTRTYSGHMPADDTFLGQLRFALSSIAQSAPEKALYFLAQIQPSLHKAALHLHLHTILANPNVLKNHFLDLLGEDHLLESGWEGAEWKSFADAAAAVFPYLTDSEQMHVEDIIFSQNMKIQEACKIARYLKTHEEKEFYYRRDYVMHCLRWSGFDQWCVLRTIGQNNLTAESKRRFDILDRKFPNQSVPEPRDNDGYTVGSPIKTDRAAYMSDADWLKAMAKYTEPRKPGYGPNSGGAHELSIALQQCAKEDLSRFAHLMTQIPDSMPKVYIDKILWAFYEHDVASIESLRLAILDAHHREGHPYGESISRLIAKYPELTLEDDIFEILMYYAENGGAEENQQQEKRQLDREKLNVRDLMEHGHRLYVTSSFGARSQATEALEYVLWKVPERIEAIKKFINHRIEVEPLISIRCALMETLKPLYDKGRKECGEMAESLVAAYSKEGSILPKPSAHELTPLLTHEGIYLFRFLLYGSKEAAGRMLERLRSSQDDFIKAVAAYHVFNASFGQEEFIAEADLLMEQSTKLRVLAADIAAQMISVGEYQDRVCDQLVRFFNDENDDVRKKASAVFRKLSPQNSPSAHRLISEYLQSPSFDGEDSDFFNYLKTSEIQITDYLITAAEKLIAQNAKDEHSNRIYRDFYHLHELLRIEYTASEHNHDLRRRLLDIIDTCLEQDISGVDSIVQAHDRAA